MSTSNKLRFRIFKRLCKAKPLDHIDELYQIVYSDLSNDLKIGYCERMIERINFELMQNSRNCTFKNVGLIKSAQKEQCKLQELLKQW